MHEHLKDAIYAYKSKESDLFNEDEAATVLSALGVIIGLILLIRALWVLFYTTEIPIVSAAMACGIFGIYGFSLYNGRGTDGWYALLSKANLYKINSTTVGIEGFHIKIHVEDISSRTRGPLYVLIIHDDTKVYPTDMSYFHMSTLASKIVKVIGRPLGKVESAASILNSSRK